MKITIATGPIFPVPAVRGGAVQRLWEGLAREFAKRGHEVTIFAREFPGQAAEETVDGIRYLRWGGYAQSTSIKRDLVMCLLYALRAARHVPRGDVVVTNDFWMPAVLPRVCPAAGRIVVNANRFPKNQYWLYSKCAAFAAVSEPVAREIRRQTPSLAGKIALIPNSIDSTFLEVARAPHSAPCKQDDPLKILFAGRIHPEKGVASLLYALRVLSQTKSLSWECVLVGPVAQAEGGGGEVFEAKMRALIDGLPVKFEEPVYDPIPLAKIYDDADVFVYPSVAEKGESFGIAPLEAMARGLVPVVSDLAVFREYLEAGKNGVIFNHRSENAAEQLATALAELLADADMRTELGKAARSTAERFSPAAIADKYLQLFEKVVSGT